MADTYIVERGGPTVPIKQKMIDNGDGTYRLAVDVQGIAFAGDVEVDTDELETRTGGLTEAAPATDTASSGLNGRLQRIAQRMTSFIALLPSSIGQKAKAASLAVTLASDEDDVNVNLSTLISGEDQTTNRMLTEQRFNYGRVTADGSIKSGEGFVHTVTFSATGAVTAGVITLYDNTAESGTVIWSGVIQVGLNPTSILLDCVFATGLYVGFDGTIANVAVTVGYR